MLDAILDPLALLLVPGVALVAGLGLMLALVSRALTRLLAVTAPAATAEGATRTETTGIEAESGPPAPSGRGGDVDEIARWRELLVHGAALRRPLVLAPGGWLPAAVALLGAALLNLAVWRGLVPAAGDLRVLAVAPWLLTPLAALWAAALAARSAGKVVAAETARRGVSLFAAYQFAALAGLAAIALAGAAPGQPTLTAAATALGAAVALAAWVGAALVLDRGLAATPRPSGEAAGTVFEVGRAVVVGGWLYLWGFVLALALAAPGAAAPGAAAPAGHAGAGLDLGLGLMIAAVGLVVSLVLAAGMALGRRPEVTCRLDLVVYPLWVLGGIALALGVLAGLPAVSLALPGG